ncbi:MULTISPECIES: pilus assembly protein TadG-related protein [unclassified Sphingomonas]|jgi:uncharacterized membrane protein|uniref:pilus assembly protein TadG-related protein n=1 Tax=unclassified Sphingomonas TaxID=196159 RepID=UPI0008355DDD|nr:MULTISPECIES: pilus assembly protein TadG-related protein [unclassified Sphingomonas]
MRVPVLRDLARDRRGGAAVLVAGAMPMLIAGAALAVDIGAVQLDTRRLQGIADSAALAAARHPERAEAAVAAVIAQAGWRGQITPRIVRGDYRADPAVPPDLRFSAAATGGGNAFAVTLAATSPTYFARVFGQDQVAIARRATAARQDSAAFSIGTRLAALEGGIVNALLSGLLGTSVGLSVADYQALVAADVDLLTYLDAVATRARIDAASYDEILARDVSGPTAIEALADTVDDATAKAALRAMAAGARGDAIALDALIDLGPAGARDTGPAGMARVDALSMLRAIAEMSNGRRQVEADLPATVPGVASTRVTLAIGERPAQSPFVAVSADGTPILRTAQVRMLIASRLTGAALPGLGGNLTVNVPIFVELAAGEARLAAIDCDASAGPRVTLDARPGLGRVAIAQPDMTRFADFTQPLPLASARLVNVAGLVRVNGAALVDLGAAEPWQAAIFAGDEIGDGTIKRVSSGHAVEGVASSLIGTVKIDVELLGLLPVPATPIVQALGGVLATVAPALDGLVDTLTGLIGVRYGQADLQATGVRCGQPFLVA